MDGIRIAYLSKCRPSPSPNGGPITKTFRWTVGTFNELDKIPNILNTLHSGNDNDGTDIEVLVIGFP